MSSGAGPAVAATPVDDRSQPLPEPPSSFEALGVDERVLEAIAEAGWAAPTLIQRHAIQAALAGKDVLARGACAQPPLPSSTRRSPVPSHPPPRPLQRTLAYPPCTHCGT